MEELSAAFALVLVIEGVLYALFPAAMQRMMREAMDMPESWLRRGGLAAVAVGVGLVWLIRG